MAASMDLEIARDNPLVAGRRPSEPGSAPDSVSRADRDSSASASADAPPRCSRRTKIIVGVSIATVVVAAVAAGVAVGLASKKKEPKYSAAQVGSWTALGGFPCGSSDCPTIYTGATVNDRLLVGGGIVAATGASGSVNLRNLGLAADATGSPPWSLVGGGADNLVRATLAVGSVVYVGGEFETVEQANGTVLPCAGAARWDTVAAEWSCLGRGVSDSVSRFARDPRSAEAVFVMGLFSSVTQADGTDLPSGLIARWTGSAWEGLGGGVGSMSQYFAVSDAGFVYVAGATSAVQPGGQEVPIFGVGVFDGVSWSSLGTLPLTQYQAATIWFQGHLHMVAVSDGALYRWETQWVLVGRPVGAITPGSMPFIISVAVDAAGETLFAGGAFLAIEGADGTTEDAPGIAQWNGQQWRPVAGGIAGSTPRVDRIAPLDNGILVSGEFATGAQADGSEVATQVGALVWKAPA